MPAKRDIVSNTFFNEYVYDCALESTIDKKRFLNGKLMGTTATKKKLRQFTVNSSIEDKILMLGKLGMPCAIIFNCDREKLAQLKKRVKGMSNNKISEILVKEEIFAFTDKELLMFAGVMASNCHSETALLNRDYLNSSMKLNEWRQSERQSSTKDSKDSIQSCREIAKFMYSTIMLSNFSEGHFGISDMQMAVLLYFLSKERAFISLDELKIAFNGVYRVFRVLVCVRRLVKSHFLEVGIGEYSGKYKLTGWGLEIAMKFQKKVFSTDI